MGYSVKARGIARDLFGNEEHYVLPCGLCNGNDLLKAFQWLQTHEGRIRKHFTVHSCRDTYPRHSKPDNCFKHYMILMVYILTIAGTIALIFFSVDWTIELYKWQSRIHGRWTDRKSMAQAVEKRHANGYTKALPVQITDQDRLVLWDMLKELSFHHHTKLAGCRTPLSLPEQGRPKEYVKRHPSLFIKKIGR